MASSKVFLSCLTVLILFNVVFYLITTSGQLLPTDSMFGFLVTIGLIAIGGSVITLSLAGTAIKWFFSTLVIVGIIFGTTVQVLGYNFQIGLGLGQNMISLFAGDITGLGLLPFLFFSFISLIATISGIMLVAGGD